MSTRRKLLVMAAGVASIGLLLPAKSLGEFGDTAKSAVPHLHGLVTNNNDTVREAAKEALRRIMSETLTNAPIQ